MHFESMFFFKSGKWTFSDPTPTKSGKFLIFFSEQFPYPSLPKSSKKYDVFIKSINKLHDKINSITILFHPKGLIGYCDFFSICGKKFT